jgi:hypothetical protein
MSLKARPWGQHVTVGRENGCPGPAVCPERSTPLRATIVPKRTIKSNMLNSLLLSQRQPFPSHPQTANFKLHPVNPSPRKSAPQRVAQPTLCVPITTCITQRTRHITPGARRLIFIYNRILYANSGERRPALPPNQGPAYVPCSVFTAAWGENQAGH